MDTVSVRLSDLIQVRDSLNSSYYHNLALDMADSYRKLNRQNRGSPMTLALQAALAKTNEYLDAADANSEPTDVPA
jgi:hypothetical protein